MYVFLETIVHKIDSKKDFTQLCTGLCTKKYHYDFNGKISYSFMTIFFRHIVSLDQLTYVFLERIVTKTDSKKEYLRNYAQVCAQEKNDRYDFNGKISYLFMMIFFFFVFRRRC